MERNLIKDFSNFTAIAEGNIYKVSQLSKTIIESYIYEASQSEDNVVDIDLGFGKLSVEVVPGEIRYKFVPSPKMEKEVRSAIKKGKNPVLQIAEKKLEERIIRAYKDMLL